MISNSGERLISPEKYGIENAHASKYLSGGETIEESAKIFEKKSSRGEGTSSQKFCCNRLISGSLWSRLDRNLVFAEAVSIAEES